MRGAWLEVASGAADVALAVGVEKMNVGDSARTIGALSALSELELKAEVAPLLERLEAAGAHVYVPRSDLDYALSVGLRMLRLRRLVHVDNGLYRVRTAELPLLRYYANSIAHHL